MTASLVLGTRGSKLALAQSQLVADALTRHTGRPVEVRVIKTRGDQIKDKPLHEIGGKGLFTKEIEVALLDGSIHFAVHSMKDMPTEQPEGLVFAAVPSREDPCDAIVGHRLEDLPHGAVVGTGSLRRRRQLEAARPDLEVRGIRGNVGTRIRKVHDGDYDAVVVAASGLRRLGRLDDAAEVLSPEVMLPAVGQGALAVQVREDDAETRGLMSAVHDPITAVAIEAERAFLRRISGGCSVPAACHAVVEGESLWVRGCYAPIEGEPIRTAEARGSLAQAEELGVRVAESVMVRPG
jgi:hydroxymethylbilane synthase